MHTSPKAFQNHSKRFLVNPKQGLLALLFALLFASALSASQAFALDVNKASLEQLQTVEGVGPVIAQRILDERRKGGRFASTEDLIARVKGVGDKTAGRITSGSGLKKGTKATRSKTSAAKSSSKKKTSTAKKATDKKSSSKKSSKKTKEPKKKKPKTKKSSS